MTFQIKILGTSSATPTIDRNHSSQLVSIQNHYFLVDCGEATQLQLLKYKVKILKINAIFISHLHGDHYLGLFGLLATMQLQSRDQPLWIYGPSGLDELITLHFKYSQMTLGYALYFVDTEKEETILFQDEKVIVEKIPLQHRISCMGFIFKEQPKKRSIIKEYLPEDVKIQDILRLKDGYDIYNQTTGALIKNESVTNPPKKSYSYAYCTDTLYDERIISRITGVDLLYHESTFLADQEARARDTFHSTARQAATIALKANVNKLLLGHFSARYKDLKPFLDEAKAVFQRTVLAVEGMDIIIEDEV